MLNAYTPPPTPTFTENGACVYGWPWLTRLMVSRAKGEKASAFFIVPSVWGINDSSLLLILCGRGFLTFDYESTPAKKCIALFSPVRMVGKSFVSKIGHPSPSQKQIRSRLSETSELVTLVWESVLCSLLLT